MEFGLVLGANLESRWPPRRPKTPKKPLQEASKKIKKKTSNERSALRQHRGGGTPWARGEICGFLEVLASILGGFLCCFEVLKTY